MNQRTQHEFLLDLEELVEQLFTDIPQLRQTEGPHRRELLARIFRHTHSIKGIATTAGFTEVGKLAHQVESLLDNARSGQIAIEDRFVETLEQAANTLSENLSGTAAGSDLPVSDELMKSLHNFDLTELNDEEPQAPPLPADFSNALNESEKLLLREAVRESEKLYLVTCVFALNVFDKEYQALRSVLTRQGAIISSLPSGGAGPADRVVFRILCSSAYDEPAFRAELTTFPQAVIEPLPSYGETTVVESHSSERAKQAANSVVRIEISELDRLISSAHEVFGQTVAALDLVSKTLSADTRAELLNLDAQIRESLVALEEQIIQLRLVSLERVIQRAIRAGRVAAKVSGKQVTFITAGENLRIDKVICDAVAYPLLHLVRNAVDQGIETPAERAAAGKSSAGTVRIEAGCASGRVRFRVSDDGRGIDPKIVSKAAARLGIVDEGTLLSNEKSLRLIFRSGFSTTSQISSVSGRGVGLDIVESAIERAGGAVRVRTQVGQGSEFEIRLPNSLGVMRALVLSSGGYRYCVDAGLIVDRCLVPGGARANSISWHGETVPVVDLGTLLGHNAARGNEDLRTLICQFSDEFDGAEVKRRQAITVESIKGTEEVLVRGLGLHSALWPGIVGATELWDGSVALVLDLLLMLSMSLK